MPTSWANLALSSTGLMDRSRFEEGLRRAVDLARISFAIPAFGRGSEISILSKKSDGCFWIWKFCITTTGYVIGIPTEQRELLVALFSALTSSPDLFQPIFSVRRLALQNLLAVLLQLGLHYLVSTVLSEKKENYLMKNCASHFLRISCACFYIGFIYAAKKRTTDL